MFVLAGFVNEAEWWLKFSKQWMQWLKVHPYMPYLKMDEIGTLCAGWSSDEIKSKLRGFVEIIKAPPLPTVTYISHDLDKFAKWKERMLPPANDPFLPLLFASPVYPSLVGDEQARTKNEHCEVIFDKQEMFGPRLQIMYPEMRNFLCRNNPRLSVLPRQPRFEDDKDCPPLQAADLMAWMIRHAESQRAE